MKALLGFLSIGLAVLAVVGGFYWAEFRSSAVLLRPQAIEQAEYQYGTLSVEMERLFVDAELALTWSEPSALLASAGLGQEIVTAVFVAPGDVIENGTTVIRVGNEGRAALLTESPLHRSLKRGDSGPDVKMLQEALMDAGYLNIAQSTQEYGSATSAAVLAFQNYLGIAEPGEDFNPGHVLWTDTGPGSLVSSVEVAVGSVVSPGATIATFRPEVTTATMDLSDVTPGLENLIETSWGLSVADLRIGLRALDSSFQSRIWQLIERPADESLVEDAGEGTQQSGPLPDRIGLTLRSADELELWRIPGTAVVIDGANDDGVCIFGRGSPPVPIPIEVVESSAGIVTALPASAGVAEPKEIVLNPLSLSPDGVAPSC